ncbi:nuclear transport factor 2 family protein [Pseudonocardia ailaonensis]|uniref:Nuclear transport factor 2 family protein n=1 Tax=Pseudonocardia ailaonensis TaxID=367279 RepID=A0ABN2N4S8_9PSEU
MADERDADIPDVIASELRLLEHEVRASPAALRELLDPEFHEFGASGRVWDLGSILTFMGSPDDHKEPPEIDRIRGVRLADDVVLLTYRSRRRDLTVLRSSVWRRRDGGWRVFFHQGTVQPLHLSES